MKSLRPTCIATKIPYVGNKLSTCFHVKGVTEFKQNHDIIYHDRCLEIECNDHYLGETACGISEKVLGHAGRDPNLHLFKHSVEKGHPVLDRNNYMIIEKGTKAKLLEK